MMRPTFKLLILSSIILLFSQCKKEEESATPEGKKLGEVELSNNGLDLLPYLLNDSLIFRDSLGNSQLFVVENKKTHFGSYYKSGGTDISTDYYDIQNLSLSLKGNNDSYFNFSLTAPLPKYVSNYHINKYYFIVSFYPDLSSPYANSRQKYNSYIDSMDFYYNLQGNAIPYYSSFTLLNKTFNSVYELSDNSPGKIYYSTSLGVVGFKTEDNNVWYLSE